MLNLKKKINYKFKDKELLKLAFTHSSYTNENKDYPHNNERLEFLGDSVVNLVVTDLTFDHLKNSNEGDLTKLRASMVCENSFAEAARELTIDKYIRLGNGEEKNGGRHRPSLLADTFEAVMGAIYLDSDFNTVKNLLNKIFREEVLIDLTNNAFQFDYKTQLQEKYFKLTGKRVKYIIDGESGPDHDKTFYSSVRCDTKLLGKGKGKSKKEAEHDAARVALNNLGLEND